MLRPLAFDVSQFNIPQGIPANIESACERGLPELLPAICSHDGTFVIVGSGPSLKDHADDIRAEQALGRPVCAIKAAHDWLLRQGIKPELFLSIEPRDRRNNVEMESETTVYLLASRCAPELFDFLADRNVMLWHCLSTPDEEAVFKGRGKYRIGGMSTSGLRAINVGYFMGYRKFVLYGMDSCNGEDGITKRIDGSLTGQRQDVIVGGRKFICNVAMAKQAFDFQYVYTILPGINIDVKGDGLLAAINAERKKQGKPT